MKMTVAMRVVGGFAIITSLLIVMGIFSLTTLNSIDSATEEVSSLALPTVSGSSQLKVSFLNMGRITTEAYYEDDLQALSTKLDGLKTSQSNFETELNTLKGVVSQEAQLKSSLAEVDAIYDDYRNNVLSMFANRKADLEFRNKVLEQLYSVEDNADDTSTLVLDFSDLSAVQNSPQLTKAAEVANTLETKLMTLITVGAQYVKTQNLVRADTIGNEVNIVVDQIKEIVAEVQNAAGSRDTSGTLNEIYQMTAAVTDVVTSSNGLLQNQITKLNKQNLATEKNVASEANIKQATEKLNILLKLADNKASAAKKRVESAISSGNFKTILIAIISVLIASVIAYFGVKAIIGPLHKVNEMLNIVSSGDLTRRLDDSSDDEFGMLAKNCNNLIDSLKTLISGISSRAAQLAAASEETSAVTLQTTNSLQEQKSQIAQVATATTEMHSTSVLVSQSAEDTLREIQHADEEAEKVKAISEENRRIIEVLARDVEEAADVINKLHQDSASIGGILDVIRGVADQTNLLALNAAIEAARAGEQGRGFAVVADEVRTLASRTQKSTQEINSMIEVLQAGAEKAVSVMNQGKEQTTICVAQTEKAADALQLITDAVHRARDVSSQIAQSAKEQNIVSLEISEKLENIVNIAEETSVGAHQTSESSHEVAQLAEELQSSVQQFKV
ncbi:MAG: methyl-accepting chemotaxis protein [Paraglaciecola sp.]|jgi:methyl-accepting chemotaxis protein